MKWLILNMPELKASYKLSNFLLHIGLWIGYLIFAVFIFYERFPLATAFQQAVIFLVPQLMVVYLNTEILIPQFIIKKKYLLYVLMILTSLVAIYFLFDFISTNLLMNNENFAPRRSRIEEGFARPFRAAGSRRLTINNLVLTMVILFLITAFKTSQMALKKDKEAADLKSENLDTELKLLRSQINPHFLFNALHNINSLALIKSDLTSQMLVKLSDMLRYIIYDCKENKVPLGKEISYIQNYISLLKLKEQDINITVSFDIENDQVWIEPMLLIPFIENSFKHSGIEDTENGWIEINMKATTRQIDFQVDNSIPKESYTLDKVGGIGLNNVTRRLTLLYPDNYNLDIDQNENRFSVKLTLLL